MNIILQSLDKNFSWAILAQQGQSNLVEIGVLESVICKHECQYIYTDSFGCQAILDAGDIAEALIEVQTLINKSVRH